MLKFIILLALLLVGCGSESQMQAQEPLPPPIPPVYQYPTPPAPRSPSTPLPQTQQQPTHDQYLRMVASANPQITIQEGYGSQASAKFMYNRCIVTMGVELKSTLTPDAYLQRLLHEISHCSKRTGRRLSGEGTADYWSVLYMRRMMQRQRYRNINRRIDRASKENVRKLKRNRSRRRSYTHPTPECREEIYDNALYERGIPQCAANYLFVDDEHKHGLDCF